MMNPWLSLPRERWVIAARGAAAGFALAAVCFAGGGLLLFSADGLLGAAGSYAATLVVALAAGIWAGAADWPDEPVRGRRRWTAAALATAVAGAFALFWTLYEGGPYAPPLRWVAVLPFAGAVYLTGIILPLMLEQGRRATAMLDPEERWDASLTTLVALLGGGAAGALLASRLLLPAMGPGPLLFATAGLLVLPTLLPALPSPADERVLLETESPLSEIEVIEILVPGREPERRLYVNGEEESGELARSGRPTLAYIVAAEEWLARVSEAGDRYLFLGGGAYTLPRRVAERDPSAGITVAELDPAVTAAAYRFFGVRPEHGIATINGDARAVATQLLEQDRRFERIFVDVYAGAETLPVSLVTLEAFGLLREMLTPGGTLALNVIGNVTGPGSVRFWSIIETLSAAFPNLALYPHLGPDFADRQNVLVAATAGPGAAFAERAGLFIRWPRAEWPRPSGAAALRDVQPLPSTRSGVSEPASSPSEYSPGSDGWQPASALRGGASDPSASASRLPLRDSGSRSSPGS